jgi:aryl-alcohol dehydrogenase-like predicted oxidoreductase
MLGTWAFAKDASWGPQPDELSIRTVHAALDVGLHAFDCAPGYGQGEAERVLGKALRGRREEAYLATKVSRQDLSRNGLITSCEGSLERLEAEVIDLLQVHWPSHEIPPEESIEALEALKKAGKIRAYGVCNFGPRDLKAWLEAGAAPETNQIAYSLLARAVEYDFLPLCQKHRMGVLPYSPLMQGLLTGKFKNADEVPEPRARSRHFRSDRPMAIHGEAGCEELTFATIDAIRAIAEEVNMPMDALALAWLLHQPSVTSVIVGVRNPDQLERNRQALDIALPPPLLEALNACTEELKGVLGRNPDLWQTSGRIQ